MATAKLWWNGSSWVTSDTTCVYSNSLTQSSYAGVIYSVKLIAYDDLTISMVAKLSATSSYGAASITGGTKTMKSGSTTIGTGSFTKTVTQYTSFSWSGNVSCGENDWGTTAWHSGTPNNASGTINITSSPFVTITYVGNGGENTPDPQTVCKDVNNSVSSVIPTRSHYQFAGWSTNPNATNATYYSGSDINVSSDTTLYAVWIADAFQLTVTKPNTANVTILKNGEAYYGSVINQDDELEIVFSPIAGFFINTATLNGVAIDSGDTYTVNGDVTIVITTVAQYSTINEYDLSVNTGDTFHLTVNRYSTSHYCRIRFLDSNEQLLDTSSIFETSMTFAIPRRWFGNFPSNDSITITAVNTTYTDPNCTPGSETGNEDRREFVVIADSGMAPDLSTGYVSLSPDNTGTAATELQDNLFIKGYSKVKATFDTSKIDNAIGASIDHYEIRVQNVSSTASSTSTVLISNNTLNSAVAEDSIVECYVYDTRGRYSKTNETIVINNYTNPSLQPLVCKRSDDEGHEDDGGRYMTIVAQANISGISNNSVKELKLYAKRSADANYTPYGDIQDATLHIFGPFSPDESYNVKVEVKDKLLNQASSVILMPKRSWEFHIGMINGNAGAAFGKQTQYGHALQLAAGWKLMVGATEMTEANLSYMLGLKRPQIISISLSDTDWTAHSTLSDVYTQIISVSDATTDTKIDLQADAATYLQLNDDGVIAMYVETSTNSQGNPVFTVYSVGAAPSVSITLQAVVTMGALQFSSASGVSF